MELQPVAPTVPITPVLVEPELPESIVYYLKQLCGINGITYTLLDKSKYYGITDKREINKIFFAGYTKPADVSIAPAQRKALQDMFAKRGDVGGRAFASYESRKRYYHDACIALNSRLADMLTAKRVWELLQSMDTASLIPPVEKLLSEGRVTMDMASAAEGKLRFKTVSPTVLRYADKVKNVDMSVDMGTFTILISISENYVRILKGEKNMDCNGYYHPHVSSSGIVCWGNAQSTIETALEAMDVYKIVNTCILLLSEYNNESPYQSLAQFKDVEEWEYISKTWMFASDLSKLGILVEVEVEDTWYRDIEKYNECKVYLYKNRITGSLAVRLGGGRGYKEIGTMTTFLDHPRERDNDYNEDHEEET